MLEMSGLFNSFLIKCCGFASPFEIHTAGLFRVSPIYIENVDYPGHQIIALEVSWLIYFLPSKQLVSWLIYFLPSKQLARQILGAQGGNGKTMQNGCRLQVMLLLFHQPALGGGSSLLNFCLAPWPVQLLLSYGVSESRIGQSSPGQGGPD